MLYNFDYSILNFIQDHMRCGLLDAIVPKITMLGNWGLLWIAVSAILMLKKKSRKIGITLIAGLLMGLIIGNGILKNLVARPRPCWGDIPFERLIANPTDYSFPSGHTLSSFIAAITLYRADKRPGIAALVLAALIAFSRLYLYVHYPSDVLGAIALAFIIAYAANRWVYKKL